MNGHQGGQRGNRRDYQGNDDSGQNAGAAETEEAEVRSAPGMGDQPDAREIPIASAPPEER